MYRKRRILTVAAMLAAAMMLTALPAAAKKGGSSPGGGGGQPAVFEVTMEFVGSAPGFATTCSGSSSLTMVEERGGQLRSADGAQLEMNLPIPWNRNWPTTTSGMALTGCHGGLVDGSAEFVGDDETNSPVFTGAFVLIPSNDGTVTLTGRFDYYWKFGPALRGKNKTVQTVLELFDVHADLHGFDWGSSETQQVTGIVELLRFEKLLDGTGAGWVTVGSTDITMTLTITAAT